MLRFASNISDRDLYTWIAKIDPVIVEIGAHYGEDSKRFLKLFQCTRLHCFEADPRCVEVFKQRVEDSRCTLYGLAVSDKTGEANWFQSGGVPPGERRSPKDLVNPDDWDYSSSLCRPKVHLEWSPWCIFDREITVQTMRLDDWAILKEVDHIDFLWMDVQGAEGKVFAGASEILKTTRFVYTEYYDREMYEGQLNLRQLQEVLTGFDLVATYGAENALFSNRSM